MLQLPSMAWFLGVDISSQPQFLVLTLTGGGEDTAHRSLSAWVLLSVLPPPLTCSSVHSPELIWVNSLSYKEWGFTVNKIGKCRFVVLFSSFVPSWAPPWQAPRSSVLSILGNSR